MIRTAAHDSHLRAGPPAMAMPAAGVGGLSECETGTGGAPDEAFPNGHGPIAFEKDGDIWAATRTHPAHVLPTELTPRKWDPAVSPDGR